MHLKSLPLEASGLKFAGADAGAGVFEGYIAHFGTVDAYGDVIEPGAFAGTLEGRSRPVLMRYNHRGPLIGKWRELREDAKGLFGVGELTPGHSIASDVRASMLHGSVAGLSFAYTIPSGGAQKDGRVRHLRRLNLIEAGPVEEPANVNATLVSVKSALEGWKSLADVEEYLRDTFGLSQGEAVAFVSRVKALRSRESDAKAAASAIDAAFKGIRIEQQIMAAFQGCRVEL